MAGYSVSSRIDSFMFAPIQGLALAGATFVGQNLGAGQVSRARKGANMAMIVGTLTTVGVSILAFTFMSSLLRIFTTDEAVIYYGSGFMRVFVPFYFMLGFSFIVSAALRGSGDVRVPTLLNILCFVVLRQLYLFVVTGVTHTVTSIAVGFPVGWFVAGVSVFIYYKTRDWSHYEKPTTDSQ